MDERSAISIFSEGAEMLNGKNTLHEARNISNESMESIYALAHDLYANRRYAEAEKSFELLCLYNHKNSKYWKGLGYTRQMMKKYRESAVTLSYGALQCDEYDAELHLSLSECLIMMGDGESAKTYLEELLEKELVDENRKKAELLYEQLHKTENN
ncbi:MAG: tetratricopeptide repeat protein [Candidatus Oxydemutatoraceae bacterium WSBS_2016_MAG_OTU14]